jgi:hypothetical protein
MKIDVRHCVISDAYLGQSSERKFSETHYTKKGVLQPEFLMFVYVSAPNRHFRTHFTRIIDSPLSKLRHMHRSMHWVKNFWHNEHEKDCSSVRILRCQLILLCWQKFFFHDLEEFSFPNECWVDCLVKCIWHEKDCFREYKLTTLPIPVSWVNLFLQTFQRKFLHRCVFWDVRLGQCAEETFPCTIRMKWIVLHCV